MHHDFENVKFCRWSVWGGLAAEREHEVRQVSAAAASVARRQSHASHHNPKRPTLCQQRRGLSQKFHFPRLHWYFARYCLCSCRWSTCSGECTQAKVRLVSFPFRTRATSTTNPARLRAGRTVGGTTSTSTVTSPTTTCSWRVACSSQTRSGRVRRACSCGVKGERWGVRAAATSSKMSWTYFHLKSCTKPTRSRNGLIFSMINIKCNKISEVRKR